MENNKLQDLTHQVDGSDDETTPNDQLNDAVEAAVMKIVNGTFDTDVVGNKKKRKHSGEDDVDDDYEFAQWTGFLDDKFMNASSVVEEQQEEEPVPKKKKKSDKSDKKKKKKKKKDKKKHHDQDEEDKVDVQDSVLELVAQDVEQLKDALEIAEEHPDSGSAGEGEEYEYDDDDNDNDDNEEEEVQSIEPVTEPLPEATAKRGRRTRAPKGTRKKSEPKKPLELPELDYSALTNVDALVHEVSTKTTEWFEENVTPEERNKPRPFSPKEEELVAYYFGGYCYLNGMTRDELCARVWSAERKNDHFWKRIYQAFPYRTRSSVYKHIRRKFHVFDVRAIWTPEEDKKLDELALQHNNNWKLIGEILGRMSEDCRDRWRNYVKCGPKRTKNAWSQEEEDQLIKIVTEIMTQLTNTQVVDTENQLKNINWTVVSEKMNGLRSRIQCRYKWKRIANDEVKHRVSKMPDSTIDWLLRKIKSIGYKSPNGIDWDGVTQHYFRDHTEEEVAQDPYKWGSFDFKEIMDQIRKQHKDENFGDMIDQLTGGSEYPQPDEYSLLRNTK